MYVAKNKLTSDVIFAKRTSARNVTKYGIKTEIV